MSQQYLASASSRRSASACCAPASILQRTARLIRGRPGSAQSRGGGRVQSSGSPEPKRGTRWKTPSPSRSGRHGRARRLGRRAGPLRPDDQHGRDHRWKLWTPQIVGPTSPVVIGWHAGRNATSSRHLPRLRAWQVSASARSRVVGRTVVATTRTDAAAARPAEERF